MNKRLNSDIRAENKKHRHTRTHATITRNHSTTDTHTHTWYGWTNGSTCPGLETNEQMCETKNQRSHRNCHTHEIQKKKPKFFLTLISICVWMRKHSRLSEIGKLSHNTFCKLHCILIRRQSCFSCEPKRRLPRRTIIHYIWFVSLFLSYLFWPHFLSLSFALRFASILNFLISTRVFLPGSLVRLPHTWFYLFIFFFRRRDDVDDDAERDATLTDNRITEHKQQTHRKTLSISGRFSSSSSSSSSPAGVIYFEFCFSRLMGRA